METTLSERVLILYDLLKTNQSGLARLMETSKTSLYNIEKGISKNPSTDVAVALYKNAGVSMEWFCGGIGEPLVKNKEVNPGEIELLKKIIQQMEKRIASLEFTEALYKESKLREPAFANFTRLNINEGKVIPFSGATCGVEQAFADAKVAGK